MHASVLEFSPTYRESIQEAVRQGDFNGIRGTMYNKVWYLTMRYCEHGYPIEILETTLHDFWYGCYHGGRHLSHKSAEHDRLVLDTSVSAREVL
jgi:hypothetical protein